MTERLVDRWTDDSAVELRNLSYEELLAQVEMLYKSGEDWQNDGLPDEVAAQIWGELHN